MGTVIDLTIYDNIIVIIDDIDVFATYTQLSQRMAFYAGIWKTNTKQFTIPLNEAIEYGIKLPIAIKLEQLRLEYENGVPRKLTPQIVNELIINANNIINNNVECDKSLKKKYIYICNDI